VGSATIPQPKHERKKNSRMVCITLHHPCARLPLFMIFILFSFTFYLFYCYNINLFSKTLPLHVHLSWGMHLHSSQITTKEKRHASRKKNVTHHAPSRFWVMLGGGGLVSNFLSTSCLSMQITLTDSI